MRSEAKLGRANFNPERIHLYIMDLIRNDWKHTLKNETSQKSLFKTFDYNNLGTRKIKVFQKLYYKEIHFTLQSNNTKYIEPFNFISYLNFLEG